ncbi:hypothetical protein MNBD_ALPHA04-128 [hydrothermal vent metagenome]|uniref:Uncharacterized protein n=1 Tax=hydrothermal vent metagenome TaxID=652676 RepID=A0A3B0R9N7_9ZZZZ
MALDLHGDKHISKILYWFWKFVHDFTVQARVFSKLVLQCAIDLSPSKLDASKNLPKSMDF